MSRDPEEVNKLTESTYKNVMEQFNPGLRNLVNLGKSYEKSVAAMSLAGKVYFDAVSKIGENAAVSPVSRELGVVLMEISEVHRKVHLELEENCLETLRSGQMDMQKFIADGCKEALLEEKRRFCFLVDKHCTFSYQIAAFHDKARDMLFGKLPTWQDKCGDATNVPESVMSMIEGLRTPVSITPQASPVSQRHSRSNSIFRDTVPPPAPALKAQTSPLASMFTQDTPTTNSVTRETESVTDYRDNGGEESGGLGPRSVSVATGLNNIVKRPRVRTIFPHTSGTNATLLTFDEGDIITLLIPDERDGWLYGELEKTRQRGWFPSSYCRAYSEPIVNNNSVGAPPMRSKSVVNLLHQDTETDDSSMVLPPPDYSDYPKRSVLPGSKQHSPSLSASSGSSVHTGTQLNGFGKTPLFLGGGNPFTAVKLRPTVTNDRSGPVI
ncbi:brain-specific angiogenesis inhibitor 1-associated protein 2-like protein 1 isoform X3 [Salmo salar]|uniref:Brain-specific angiogenesis inhibitor 1-associated protein 2-like protein 1 isoform X3 n=1 Tax=Salmo salar TaxID=8030 RepID=A0ABM3EKB2_SALSA|nr:brain-specific angiogenesis inhibitor 1-associated protein 2-like protein 1 isoform X3 [Salmo salar]